MSWHSESCGIPDLSWDGGYPTCVHCGSSAFSLAAGAKETAPPPAPPPCPKRSQLTCSWPSCVEYSERFIDGDGNDLTKFIIENVDAWNIDATDLPDDQANLQEVGGASPRTDESIEASEPSGTWSNTTSIDLSDGAAKITSDETHIVGKGPTSTQRSDRIHENLCGSDDFRVLRLYGSTSSDDPIHCSLEVAQLDDPDVPLYEALSYTWADLDGDKRNCMPIYIGSHFDVLLVTKNCQSALRRLRKISDRLLWIDAICINQNDSIERSAQVNHMSEIYSRASRVLIYLGEPSSGPAEALAMVTICSQTSAMLRDIEFLMELAKKPYFNRLWIIQEVGLATRATVIYGGLMMHWTDLCSAFQSYGVAPEWIKHFSVPVHQRHMAPSIFELLRDTKDSLCIDPRDRLFGIIGLADTAERELLLTDYSLSVQQLYIGLAAYLIQQPGSRDFLNLAAGQRKIIPGLPSWVPDWTNIETQDGDATLPELSIGSPYTALPILLWHPFNRHTPNNGSVIAAFNDPEHPREIKLLKSPPIVQQIAGALLLYAVPLFTISRGELKTYGVARSMTITNWQINHHSKLFDHTGEFEISVIPSCNRIAVLKKYCAGVFSLRGFISTSLDPLEDNHNAPLNATSSFITHTIQQYEWFNIERWLQVVLGLHLSSNLASQVSSGRKSTQNAAIFPDLPDLRDAEESFRKTYQKSNQIDFDSGHFQAIDRMRTTMVNAIDPEDLAWRSSISSDSSSWLKVEVRLWKLRDWSSDLPAHSESVEEHISTWSSSVEELRSQLQKYGSFSDVFQDLQADDTFDPIVRLGPFESGEDRYFMIQLLGLYNALEGVEPERVHMSLFLQKACNVISRATLDENLPWDYNRDRFWMCFISFDLIVRLRLLLADRQLYAHMNRSTMGSIESPKRIMIV